MIFKHLHNLIQKLRTKYNTISMDNINHYNILGKYIQISSMDNNSITTFYTRVDFFYQQYNKKFIIGLTLIKYNFNDNDDNTSITNNNTNTWNNNIEYVYNENKLIQLNDNYKISKLNKKTFYKLLYDNTSYVNDKLSNNKELFISYY